MSKHSRGAECTPEIAITLPSMQLVTYALGTRSAGGTMVRLASDGSASTDLQPQTVSAVQEILQQLRPHEEQVVRMRYGIDMRTHAVHEIGEHLGVMPDQVERLALRAF